MVTELTTGRIMQVETVDLERRRLKCLVHRPPKKPLSVTLDFSAVRKTVRPKAIRVTF
jgi:hypothetical protein